MGAMNGGMPQQNAGQGYQSPTISLLPMGQAGQTQVFNAPQNTGITGVQPPSPIGQGGAPLAPTGNGAYPLPPQQGSQNPNVFQQSSQAYTDALAGTQAAMSAQPQDVMASRVRADQVGTNNILQGMSQYQNPFEQQVVDAALGDIERQRQMQVNNVGSQATAAGAFGGSRQGVAEAETNRAALDKSAQLAAQLRSQGFTQAADLAGRDIQNRQNADLANQSANLNASTTTADQLMRSQLANQSNSNQYANRLLSGGAQMGNLSNLGFGFGNTLNQNQMAAGNQQQQLMQQLINAGRGQFDGYSNSPQDALNLLMSTLNGSNQGQQTQTNTRNLGLADILSAVAQFG